MEHLNSFFHAIQSDSRIGISHIALYTAIVQYWSKHSKNLCIHLFSKEIMEMAKISSSSTYHRCLNDLKDWNYILYRPSYNRLKASEIELMTFDYNLPKKRNSSER